jgi:general secretion pathway protein G
MFEQIKKAKQKEGGFTLIELLVVIVILGILAAVVVFAVQGVGDKGEASACEIDKRTIQTAEEAYFAQEGPGGGDGTYGDEAALVPNFLQAESELWNVTADNTADPKTYSITVDAANGSTCTP